MRGEYRLIRSVFVVILLSGACGFCVAADSTEADQTSAEYYTVTQIYETNDQGHVRRQQPMEGWLVLYNNGRYKLKFHIEDEGTYRLTKTGGRNSKNRIYFYSNNGYEFFAYPAASGGLTVWLYKKSDGLNVWVGTLRNSGDDLPQNLIVRPPGVQPAQPMATNYSIINGAFTTVVLFGVTGNPGSYNYDHETRRFNADQKGIVFRPDGTYYMRADFGGVTTSEEGKYTVDGGEVRLRFNDGTHMTLRFEESGTQLSWYSGDNLITIFHFLGSVE